MAINRNKILFLRQQRDVSSVGSERLLDRQEVAGSNPARPTSENQGVRVAWLFLTLSVCTQLYRISYLKRIFNNLIAEFIPGYNSEGKSGKSYTMILFSFKNSYIALL